MVCSFVIPWRSPYLIIFYIFLLPVWSYSLFQIRGEIKKELLSSIAGKLIVGFLLYTSLYALLLILLRRDFVSVDFLRDQISTSLFFIICFVFFLKSNRIYLFKWAMLFGLSLNVIVSLYIFIVSYKPGLRLEGYALEPNAIICATYYSIAALFLFNELTSKRNYSFLFNSLLAILFLVFSTAVVCSVSKGVIAPFWLALCVFCWLKRRWILASVSTLFAVAVGAILLNIVFKVNPELNDFFAKTEFFGQLVRRADSYRFEIWQHALVLISENPFGFGPKYLMETKSGTYHPHNVFFSACIFFGVIPALLLAASFIMCIVQNIKSKMNEVNIMVFVLMFFLFFVLLTQQGNIIHTPYSEAWYLLWSPIALALGFQSRHSVNK
jgi:O-antigen ligase